jgi:ABC-2 type transport system ATP-binding protein
VIELDAVGYTYPRFRLEPMTCAFEPGITAVVGPNGAGKTTLLSIVSGLYAQHEGTVRIGGRPVTAAEARRLVANAALVRHWYDRRSLRDHAALFAAGFPDFSAARFFARARASGLDPAAPLGSFSAGMKTAAAIAAALARDDVRALVFDEPWNDLDPLARAALSSELTELAAAGDMTLFVSSHDLEIVRAIARRFAFVAGGRLRALGSLEAIARAHHLEAGVSALELYERVVAKCA